MTPKRSDADGARRPAAPAPKRQPAAAAAAAVRRPAGARMQALAVKDDPDWKEF
jgi:hypothetical protein